MKKILILISCLFVLSCHKDADDVFVGKWTDGHYRHISITKNGNGYLVNDISNGGKRYVAKRFGDELLVTTGTGVSAFNYEKATDGLFAGQVNFFREKASKKN